MNCSDPNIWHPNISHFRVIYSIGDWCVKAFRQSHKQFALTNTVFLVPVQFLSRWTHTFVTALRVHTAMLTAPVADAALINVYDATTKSVILVAIHVLQFSPSKY